MIYNILTLSETTKVCREEVGVRWDEFRPFFIFVRKINK